MNNHLVLICSGTYRIGLVEKISELILQHKGNVVESRLVRLGGKFAMLMLIVVKEEAYPSLEKAMHRQQNEQFKVTITQTQPLISEKYKGWLPQHRPKHAFLRPIGIYRC